MILHTWLVSASCSTHIKLYLILEIIWSGTPLKERVTNTTCDWFFSAADLQPFKRPPLSLFPHDRASRMSTSINSGLIHPTWNLDPTRQVWMLPIPLLVTCNWAFYATQFLTFPMDEWVSYGATKLESRSKWVIAFTLIRSLSSRRLIFRPNPLHHHLNHIMEIKIASKGRRS